MIIKQKVCYTQYTLYILIKVWLRYVFHVFLAFPNSRVPELSHSPFNNQGCYVCKYITNNVRSS